MTQANSTEQYSHSGFVDLLPSGNADSDNVYSEALDFALQNKQIQNIALTGPYGSGKSSIINTYEKNRNYKFLNISLASFKENSNSTSEEQITNRLIEQSILQQMLYGIDADKLPYSRFKRITTPKNAIYKSLSFTIWFLIALYIYFSKSKSIDLEIWSSEYCLLITLITYLGVLPTILIAEFYKATFGLSFKKISLKNAEIETGEHTENSILNKHLDEIIYFFQETDFQVVVIEDLDRFGDPEIFVKLREINKLVNDGTNKKVTFLYALKDDMFAHKSRAKFFDFIIPVIPVINNSNSLDKIKERIQGQEYEKSLDKQFLRDVSFFLNDMRLIHNIFNEFKIYYSKLNNSSLNSTKLLAIIIYKNAYPTDFENLHHQKGVLFQLCEKRINLIIEQKKSIESQISNIRKRTKNTTQEQINSVQELIKIYLSHIATQVSDYVSHILVNNQDVEIYSIETFEQFEPILSNQNFSLTTYSYHSNNYGNRLYKSNKIHLNKSFSDVEKEVNPSKSFLERKRLVENKSSKKRSQNRKKIKTLQQDIEQIPLQSLGQLLQNDLIDTHQILQENDILEDSLFNYLVKYGFIDDTYFIYISNFYEGRLSFKDHEYITAIRNSKALDPSHIINNPSEVCKTMRLEDFNQKFILNVALIDFLLETNDEKKSNAFKYISKNLTNSLGFLSKYFIAGQNLDLFIKTLFEEFPSTINSTLEQPIVNEIISYIFRFVEREVISEDLNENEILTDYINENGHEVFASELVSPTNFNTLEDINTQIQNLSDYQENEEFIDFAYNTCIYKINLDNILFLLKTYSQSLSHKQYKRSNFTSINSSKDTFFIQYIQKNIETYIDDVFLLSPQNNQESKEVILSLLHHENLSLAQKKNIISTQNISFPNFETITEELWEHILREKKLDIKWKNISSYFTTEEHNEDLLTQILSDNANALSKTKISIEELGEKNAKGLSWFIISNNNMEISSYSQLIESLPYIYHHFPNELSIEKHIVLSKKERITLNEDSFHFTANKNELRASLIQHQFSTYRSQKEIFPINNWVHTILLQSSLPNKYKLELCENLDQSILDSNEKLANEVSKTLLTIDFNVTSINIHVLTFAIQCASTTSESIQLLTKCIPELNTETIMSILEELDSPYKDLASKGKRPKLENNKLNVELTQSLKNKNLISSFDTEKEFIRVNTFRSSSPS